MLLKSIGEQWIGFIGFFIGFIIGLALLALLLDWLYWL